MSSHQQETKAIHVGQEPEQWSHREVVPPISLATTFKQPRPGEATSYEYGRSGNPTRCCLEKCLASLENAEHGFCFSSGLASITTLTYLLKSGDHIISGDDIYGGTNRLFQKCAARMGLTTTFVDARDVKNIAKALQPNTRLIWMETPTNPTMKLADIKAIADYVKTLDNVILAVDNTFMSPYFQKPLDLGADIVLHSISKYINGHSDVIMGVIMTRREDLAERIRFFQNALGAVPSPFDCFLVNRGVKTLAVRMECHQRNGLEIAKYLESHPKVAKVYHPGLPSHPQHELHKKQCSGSSGMISFEIKGGKKEASDFVANLEIFTLAESLGGIESLIEIPSLMTHTSVPLEQRKQLGISDSLVRVSVGIESIQDLIADMDQAFAKI